MHIVILFINIGSYHAARLRAAQATCQQVGWHLTALQVTDNTFEHPWGDLKQAITFPVHTLLPHNTYSEAQAAAQMPVCLSRLQPDVLAIPGWGFAVSRVALKWAKRHQIPTVLMSESKWDDEPRHWTKEFLKSILYVRKFDAAIVGAVTHRDYLVKLGLPTQGVALGYDIVDNHYFTQRAKAARQDMEATLAREPRIPNKPYFITITRLIERKNVLRLLAAFAQYRATVTPDHAWDLVICGSGEQETLAKQFIEEYHLGQSVHMPGFLTYQALPNWLGLAGTFIHPALSEQWGLVVNEAMASGLPVLVSNRCGCFPELVKVGVNGFGFDPENGQQLTELMVQMSSGEVDLTKMGQAALEQIQQFSPEAFGEGLKQAVEYAISHKRNRLSRWAAT